MTKQYIKAGCRLFAAFLASAVLISCTPQSRAPEDSGGGQGYEQYYAGSGTAADHAFDLLASAVFRDQVTQSALDLHYTFADPAARGFTELPLTFGSFSVECMKEELADSRALLKDLQAIPPGSLTGSRRDTWQILSAALKTDALSEGLELYGQPLTSTIGIQAQLPVLLAEYPFYSRQDADRYLTLLADIDRYYGDILEYERQKSAAGLFMSDTAADHVLESCEAYLIAPEHSFLSETFNTRIDALTDLSDEEKTAYKEKNLTVLQEHFIPAYRLLSDGITALMGTGQNDMGLCCYPKGKEYFEYLVAANTGTSYSSVKKLKKAIEHRMNEDINAMSRIVGDHPEVLEHLTDYSFSVTDPRQILESLKRQIAADFPELPENSCTVKYVPAALEASLSPAFYLMPPLDRYQDNVIYINNSSRFENSDLFPTLAHEGYPGHLYQNVYFLSRSDSDLRKILSFPSYSEGWATYVEYYSYTLDNGLNPLLGSILAHNTAATLGIYALLDININYEGWNREQTGEYLKDVFAVENDDVINSVYDALVENPTNYMEYYVGYMEISEMRDTAEKVLEDRFNLKEFHTFLLDFGPAPFSVIQPKFLVWLSEQKNSEP